MKKTLMQGGPNDGKFHESEYRAMTLYDWSENEETKLVECSIYELQRPSVDEYIYKHLDK